MARIKQTPRPATSIKQPKKSLAQQGFEKAVAKEKKKPRFHPGTVALREIRRYQKSTELLLRKRPFRRIVVEIAQDSRPETRFTKSAMEAIQVAAEDHLTKLFNLSNLVAVSNGRKTVVVNDMNVVRQMEAELNPHSYGFDRINGVKDARPTVKEVQETKAHPKEPTEKEVQTKETTEEAQPTMKEVQPAEKEASPKESAKAKRKHKEKKAQPAQEESA